MTYKEFRNSLQQNQPPQEAGSALVALWWDAKGNWQKAHENAQSSDEPDCAWVHAYLHRKEGDPWNADYWYRRAGKPSCRLALPEEWGQIAQTLSQP